MTQAITDTYARYTRQYANQPPAMQSWLKQLRQTGFDGFAQLGFPTARKGNEAWKYTNIGRVARAKLDLPGYTVGPSPDAVKETAPWADDWNTLTFVNGRFSSALSRVHEDSITVASIADSLQTNGAIAREHMGSLVSVSEDGFAALNTAFISDGAIVHIPDGSQAERPVHLVFASTNEDNFIAHPRVLVVAGREAQATIIESYIGLGDDNTYLANGVSEIIVGEGAQIDHNRLMDESNSAYHIGVARIHQADGSRFSSKSFYKGVGLGRHDLYIHIGDGCETKLDGLYITSGSQHMDNFINIDHTKPNSTSKLYYKGILSGRSRAVFGGTVFVREGAIKTDALQSDKNLLLSSEAEVDSKPALFIWADDVKCGHGATAGNVDEDTIFYMRSRAIDLETASRMLIFGFASEIIDTVEVPELHTYLERSFLDAIPSYEFTF